MTDVLPDKDVVSELKRFRKERIEAIRVFPGRLMDIEVSYKRRMWRILYDNGKL